MEFSYKPFLVNLLQQNKHLYAIPKCLYTSTSMRSKSYMHQMHGSLAYASLCALSMPYLDNMMTKNAFRNTALMHKALIVVTHY